MRNDSLADALAYSPSQAAAVACASRTAIYEAIRAGALIARKRGARTVILRSELDRWLRGFPTVRQRAPTEVTMAAASRNLLNHRIPAPAALCGPSGPMRKRSAPASVETLAL